MTTTDSPPDKAVRRRAVRAAGPAKDGPVETTAVRLEKPVKETPKARKAGPPPRRPAHLRLVALVASIGMSVAVVALCVGVGVMFLQQKKADEAQARDQRFVDTATHTIVNMYTFKQDTLEDSVNQLYAGMSGPLRDGFSKDNFLDNLKALLRATGNSSEAVVNGAVLESIDDVSDNASVLVSVRVTQADGNGNNLPSQPFRWRVIVHEDVNVPPDDSRRFTTYDLMYPDGGS